MKKGKYLVILGLILFLTSGCEMVATYETTITKDKQVNQKIVLAVDNEMLENLLSMQNPNSNQEFTEEEKWEMLDEMLDEENQDYEGYTKERYETTDLKGYAFTKNLGNIENLTGDTINFSLEDEPTENIIMFTKKGNNYFTEFEAGEPFDTDDTDQYNIDYTVEYIVTLPTKAINHNATTISEDGKTLTWDLTTPISTISYEFAFANNTILYIIIGGVAVVILLGIGIFLYLKRRK